MYCKNCGSEIHPDAAICVKCGFWKGSGNQYCANCGKEVTPGAVVCMNCGFATASGQPFVNGNQKSMIIAAILAFFLGSFGAHNFYLGFTKRAILQIVLTVVTCGIGGIWGFVEFIMLLVGHINKDANGVPLNRHGL